MTRPVVERFQCLSVGVAMATAIAACSSDVPSKARLDAGADRSHADVIEVGADHTGAGPDRPDAGSDQLKETQPDITAEVSTDGSAEAADRFDVRVDTTDSFLSDATDLARDVLDQSIETGGGGAEAGADTPLDVGPDLPPDEGPPDLPSDTASSPACGDGCPSTIQPNSLALWLSADFGVTCDGTGRISDWKDRALTSRSFKPATGGVGPACGTATLASKPVATFDRGGATDTGAVLPIDLTPLVRSDYTVFVVERRRSGSEGYMLGSNVPNPAQSTCDNTPYLAYRMGYFSTSSFYVGVYGFDNDTLDCSDIVTSVSPFSSTNLVAVIDVERFAQSDGGHFFYIGSALQGMNADPTPLDSLPVSGPGYLGRAFQMAVGRDSRFQGDIAEVIIYKTSLSDADRAAITTYLAGRWLP